MTVSRRKVLAAATWTPPVLLVASITPAYATSDAVCVPAEVSRVKITESYRKEGKRGGYYVYSVEVTLRNKRAKPSYVVSVGDYTIGPEGLSLEKKIKGNPKVIVTSCNKVVWHGNLGKDC